MKKIVITITTLCIILCMVLGIEGMASQKSALNNQPLTLSQMDNIPKPLPLSQMNNNPKPLFEANKDIDKNTLISESELINKINETKNKSVNSNIKSTKLKTWKQFNEEDDPGNKSISYQIDPDRMVWAVETEYPDGIETKIGFYANATVTTVYDAQTFNIFESKVTGKYQGQK